MRNFIVILSLIFSLNGWALSGIKRAGSSASSAVANAIENIGLEAAQSSVAADSIKITSADGTALSSSNIGKVRIQSATPGQVTEFEITADVTIDLTGANWGAVSDLTDAVLHVYALNNNGSLVWGVHQESIRDLVLGSEDSATPGDINTSAECLVNSVLSADAQALHIGYFKVNFDLTGGSSSDLWVVQTGDQDIGIGIWPINNTVSISNTGNGHGSTNNKIRILTTHALVGSGLTYSTSAGAGNLHVINESGFWNVVSSDVRGGGTSGMGVSVNSSQLTTAIISITEADIVFYTGVGAAVHQGLSKTRHFNLGDHVRMHTDGAVDGGDFPVRIELRKVGN